MATYYKYAERAAGSQVNWAEIGKNLTDTLQEEVKLREEKKAAIDEASRQYGITLETSPQGDDTSLNQWGLNFAGDAQEARLLQDRLLKSGKLKLRDYTVMRQNLTDGTNIAFDLLNEYNSERKVREERAKSMDPATASQYLEQWMAAQAQGFANFKDTKLYINPTTFSVSVGKNFVTKDGITTMSNNPNDYTTVNELRNRIKAKFDKFDSSGYLKKRVDMLGKEQRATMLQAATRSQTGFTQSTEDVTLKASFTAAQEGIINEAFANPLNVSSVLTDNLGADTDGYIYDFTFDEAQAGPSATDKKNYIYMKRDDDGTLIPQFTEDQKNAAIQDMKDQMNSMLDYRETIQGYNNPAPIQQTEGQRTAAEQRKYKETAYKYWNDLRSGSAQEKAAAVQWLNGSDFLMEKNIESIGYEDGGNGITINFGATASVPAYETTLWMYDGAGNELSGEQWMASGNLASGGNVSPADAKRFGKGSKTWDESQTTYINPQTGEVERTAIKSSISKTGAKATGIVTSGY
jgi:hypothetical protein